MSVQVYDKNGQLYEADLIEGEKYRELEKQLAAAQATAREAMEDKERLIDALCEAKDGLIIWCREKGWFKHPTVDKVSAAIDQAREGKA